MPDAIEPFHLAVPQAQLDGLRRRLADARWPEPETVGDWSQGAPLARKKPVEARSPYSIGMPPVTGISAPDM